MNNFVFYEYNIKKMFYILGSILINNMNLVNICIFDNDAL